MTDDPLALLAEASQATAAELPDSAQVCNCNGVCKGAIVGAIRAGGLGSTQEVVSVTRAGAGCGSCKAVVSELLAIERAGAAEEPPTSALAGARRARTWRDRAPKGIESVSELGESCGAGRDCGACKPGLAYLVSEIQNGRFREERHARFINDRVHANIQNDGTFSVIPRIRGGVVTADQLRRIADAADKYELPMIKITGGQRIDLLGARKEQLPAIWGRPRDAVGLRLRQGGPHGQDLRRLGVLPLRPRRRDRPASTSNGRWRACTHPTRLSAAVSGCPRNCAESYVKDIGVVAVEGGWEIYVGGRGGRRACAKGGPRRGSLPPPTPSASRSRSYSFTEQGKQGEHLERTCGFVRAGRRRWHVREVVLSRPAAQAAGPLHDRQGSLRSGPVAPAHADPSQAVCRASTPRPTGWTSLRWLEDAACDERLGPDRRDR